MNTCDGGHEVCLWVRLIVGFPPVIQMVNERGKVGARRTAQLCFLTHRVAGGSCPPPAPTERGVRISRTTLFRHCLTAQRSSLSVYTGEKAWVAATDTRA